MHSENRSVDIPGGSVRVRVAEGNEPIALLLHGGPGGTDYLFKFFARPLQMMGWRAVSFIQRGSPGSPSDGPFTIDAMVDDVERVRESLGADGEKIAIVGHSWGGLLATCYAARHPERIARLALICPVGPDDKWRGPFRREIRRRLSPADVAITDELLAEANKQSDPQARAQLLVKRAAIEMMTYYSPHHREGKPGLAHLEIRVREAILDDMSRLYSTLGWSDGLNDLSCPTAVLFGMDDTIPNFVAEQYRDLLPDPLVMGLERCGHFPWMEEEQIFWRSFEVAFTSG
jgi:proline iminopeptidase